MGSYKWCLGLLEGFYRVSGSYKSGVIIRITILITHIRGLLTLLITTHEPPSRLSSSTTRLNNAQAFQDRRNIQIPLASHLSRGFLFSSSRVEGLGIWGLESEPKRGFLFCSFKARV